MPQSICSQLTKPSCFVVAESLDGGEFAKRHAVSMSDPTNPPGSFSFTIVFSHDCHSEEVTKACGRSKPLAVVLESAWICSGYRRSRHVWTACSFRSTSG